MGDLHRDCNTFPLTVEPDRHPHAATLDIRMEGNP
jgi:hypothetical protein